MDKVTLLRRVIFIASVSYAQQVTAQLVPELRSKSLKSSETIAITQYIRPNELTPILARGIYNSCSRGAQIYVGTERGFIGLGISPESTLGIFVDVNAKAVEYNRINIALLKISKSRDDYLELRFDSTQDEWISRAKLAELTPQEIELLGNREAYRLWTKFNFDQDESPLADDPREKRARQGPNADVAFEDANYLIYEDQFLHVQSLAKKDRLLALNIDLRDSHSWTAIVDAFRKFGETLALIDVSNAWENAYVGIESLAKLSNLLSPIAAPQGKLVFTKLVEKNDHSHVVLRFCILT